MELKLGEISSPILAILWLNKMKANLRVIAQFDT